MDRNPVHVHATGRHIMVDAEPESCRGMRDDCGNSDRSLDLDGRSAIYRRMVITTELAAKETVDRFPLFELPESRVARSNRH